MTQLEEMGSDTTPVAREQHFLIAIFLFRFNNNPLKKPTVYLCTLTKEIALTLSIKYTSTVILFIESPNFLLKYTCQAICVQNYAHPSYSSREMQASVSYLITQSRGSRRRERVLCQGHKLSVTFFTKYLKAKHSKLTHINAFQYVI